jgi:putative NADH-flavin reductase
MKFTIFGATGRTGIPLVQQALDAGHEVTAFVRDPAKLTIQNPKLTVVQGDVLNADDVARAITPETDAVISVLAPTKGAPADLLPRAVDHILAAMRAADVKRFIYMTGAGVDMPGDQPKLFNHFIKFMLKTMAGEVLKQSEAAVRKVEHSDREWVIVRAPMLTDQPHSGQYRVGMVGVNTGPRLSRADAADFMLTQTNGTQYVRQAPVLSN